MKQRLLALAAACALCHPQLATGATCPTVPDDPGSRAAFAKAERSPPGSRDAMKRLRGRIGEYPLFPYVERARLRKSFPRVADPEVEAFLKRHDGEPATYRLRGRWLRRLADRGEWDKLVEWRREDDPVELQCLHARALLRTGDRAGAFSEAQRLWMSGKSRPGECDPVFAAWLESDRFSPSLAWERVELAMARGGVRLARYLERFLDPPDRRLAAAWRKVHADPRRVGALKLRGEPSRVETVLVHGLDRLARRDPDAAATALGRVQTRVGLGPEAYARVARRIGLSFATRHDPKAVDWLGRVDAAHADPSMLSWRAAAAVLHARWNDALDAIASMPEEERGREKWRYWRARALEATGTGEEARAELASLARERDYYGFLAADRLGEEYRFNHRRLEVAAEVMERVVRMPGTRRALEFLALGRKVDARREWHALIDGLGEEELKAAAWIAGCRDWHGRAILTIARTPAQDDLELRFPIAHRRLVEAASSRADLPPAMVYALIRQESAFISDARSSAGALGLMQIMPRTGRALMRKLGRKWQGKRQLLAPGLNVELGTHYLRSLLSRTGGRAFLAAGSYNAGPHRVRSWLPAGGEVEAAVWIDNIPFAETRRYVRRFLAYGAIYEHRLGARPTRLSERMPPVPPRAAL